MIELKHLSKTFETASGRVDALKDVSLTIPDGDVYGIIGMSGAGKSTLVRCINMLERPTEGEVIVNGQRLDTMTPAQLRAARREITMIFQRFNLLMQRNCLANVCFPMELSGLRGEKKWHEQRALELLDIVGLKDKAKAYPAQLSGGQQQRVALARILCSEPQAILLDEPFSALDSYLKWNLELELSDLLLHTGEFVSVNDFHSGKQGLYGSNTTKNTSIDHRNGQIQTSHLRNRHLKIGLYQSILCQKSTARGGNLREIVCKGLTPSLAGCLQIETAVLQRTIVHCSGLTTLFERKSLRLYREGG